MRLALFVCAMLLTASPSCLAGVIGEDALCPGAINTKQEAVDVPADYEAGRYPGLYLLQNIGFSDGPPGSQGFMDPSETEGAGGNTTIIKTWRFRPRREYQVYFSCFYDNTTVTLVRPLEVEAIKCVITYNSAILIGGFPKIISSYCVD